jgi:hypothetical protein
VASERVRRPPLRDLDGLRADELALELRFAVLEEHGRDLFEVLAKLVERRTLRMRTRPAGDIPDEEARLRVALDDSGEAPHPTRVTRHPLVNKKPPKGCLEEGQVSLTLRDTGQPSASRPAAQDTCLR